MMYNPISTEFFDQLTVAMERKIPSRIEYYQNEEQEKKQEKQQTKSYKTHEREELTKAD